MSSRATLVFVVRNYITNHPKPTMMDWSKGEYTDSMPSVDPKAPGTWLLLLASPSVVAKADE